VENTLYYTFSTIAQALAGAVAFLGAIVFFGLQAISHLLQSCTERLRNVWLGDDEMQAAAAGSNYSAVLARAEILVKLPIPSGWGLIHKSALEGMQRSIVQRSRILHSLKQALLFAAIVMVSAVAALAGVNELASPRPLAVGALLVGVAGFGMSLLAIGNLVWKVAHDA
jgi:hypothetical protein